MCGKAGGARLCAVRSGVVRYGRRGAASSGEVWCVKVRQAR